MKSIIISENNLLSQRLCNVLLENNFEIIHYKWIIKALDNLEEIQPDMIIIDTSDYPRHWKILSQILSSKLLNKRPELFLFCPYAISSDEKKQMDFLQVSGIIKSLDNTDVSDFNFVLKSLYKEEAVISPVSIPEISQEQYDESNLEVFSVDSLIQNVQKAVEAKGYYVLTHPVTGKFITGKYLEYDGNKITCEIENEADFQGITKDTSIQYISFAGNNECKSCSATVNDYLDLLEEKFIILNVCDFYEEK